MGFSAGADDYLVKPFSNMELLMRVKAILRRYQPGENTKQKEVSENQILFRDLILDKMGELRIACDEAETLTAKKYWPFPTYGSLLFGIK